MDTNLPMADGQSIQFLAFNFASRTYTFKRLAQGLSTSVSAFSSFMQQNLDNVITADKCFQYVDGISVGAHDLQDMLEKLIAVLTCIMESGMKSATDKCAVGLKEIQFLGNTITQQQQQHMLANILSGCQKSVLVLTDKRAVTGFFQTKFIPPTLWNACDHILSFDIIWDIPRKS